MKRKSIIIIPIIILALFFSKIFMVRVIGKIGDGIKSPYVYVYNRTNGKEEMAINENERTSPASLTKIMTVYVSLNHIKDLSGIVPIDKESYQEMVSKNSSMAGFYGNEKPSYRDLLYGTMLIIGGECTRSLAVNLFGNKNSFIKEMNKTAEKMGCKDTHFTNSEGMDHEKNYSTAKEIAKIIDQSLHNGHFRAVFTKQKHRAVPTKEHPEGLVIKSTVFEELQNYKEKGFKIIGGKSGTTARAGFCWATLVEKKGKEYICVVMGAPASEDRVKDTLKIMEGI